jgi:hypothetical protein
MGFFQSEAGQQSIGGGINALLGLGTSAFTANQQKQLLKGQANLSAQQFKDAMALEQERTKQIELQLQQAKAQPSSGNKTLYIGLAVGGVVVLGGIIFAVTRK